MMRRPSSVLRVIHDILLLHILRDGICDEKSAQNVAQRELALDKMLIQLIKHACQASKQGRALDFARLLRTIPALSTATRLANSFAMPALQRAIEHLRVEHGGAVSPGSSTSQPPPKLTMTELSSARRSSGKRHADNDHSSGLDSSIKRRAIHQSLSAAGVDKTSLPQSRESRFS